MKIIALLVLKSLGDSSSSSSSSASASGSSSEQQQAVVLAIALDVSHFGDFYQRAAREFILFIARIIALRTPAGSRQNVLHDEYMVHCYNHNGLCAIAFTDSQGPFGNVFSLLDVVLKQYQKTFRESWRTIETDVIQPWQYLDDALTKYEMGGKTLAKLLAEDEYNDRIQTHIVLHKIIDTILAEDERLDSLVEKSSDLSISSQRLYKQAKKTNSSCTIL